VNSYLKLVLPLILAAFLVGTTGAGAVEPAKTKPGASKPAKSKPKDAGAIKGQPKDETPLHITAAQMEADQNQGVVVFSGNVKAEQGDTILYCDKLWVYFQKNPSPAPAAAAPAEGSPPEKAAPSPLGDMGGEKIDRIEAKGQVRYVQEDRVATGQEAVYYKDKDEVVLTGNPQVWRAENTLKGERLIFNLKDNKMVAESSPQKRVEAHLYSSTQGAPGEKGEPVKKGIPSSGLKGRKDRQN
jgi:lipopolysaccharide export system protein LptA